MQGRRFSGLFSCRVEKETGRSDGEQTTKGEDGVEKGSEDRESEEINSNSTDESRSGEKQTLHTPRLQPRIQAAEFLDQHSTKSEHLVSIFIGLTLLSTLTYFSVSAVNRQ